MPKTIVVTGGSSGLGSLIAGELAAAGHLVYADVGSAGHRAPAADCGGPGGGEVRPARLDGSDQQSVLEVVQAIGTVDVAVHCTGPAAVGPAESFTPFQFLEVYDGNLLSAQRVNRAVLPQMRERGAGLLVWVGLGGGEEVSPYLAPYAAVRAATLHLARSYATELPGFGIESSLVLTGPLLPGPGHLDELVVGDDTAAAGEYGAVFGDAGEAFVELATEQRDPADVARAVVSVVAAPEGSRPPQVTVAPGVSAGAATAGPLLGYLGLSLRPGREDAERAAVPVRPRTPGRADGGARRHGPFSDPPW